MILLGIDTSCDDTCAGILRDGREVLAQVVHTQIALHCPHGGVVPELASREHLRAIVPVVQEALDRASLTLDAIDAVAVTVGPGLVGALLVGLSYAKALALARGIPLVPVNHLEGHLLSVFLEERRPEFPFVALTVSGGHTNLYAVSGFGAYRLLGQTLDDAAGEAFDKVAKILGLGYPGGAVLEALARKGRAGAVRFPRAYLSPESLDFSFSGIKTAVTLHVARKRAQGGPLDEAFAADVAASFQDAVVEVLVEKLLRARERAGAGALVVAGGVACNGTLRETLRKRAEEKGLDVHIPRPAFCTDNGPMIALTGFYRLQGGQTGGLDTDVMSRFPLV